MCGIVGIVGFDAPGSLAGMHGAVRHRGPDDVGEFPDRTAQVALAMRRLSILDLKCGHQPMSNDYEPKTCPRRRSGNGQEQRVFDALEWLAAMSSHVPDKGEQMVRYYGYYSNVSRGKRKKQNQDEWIPPILEPEGSSKEYQKNWARLIQKIYKVNPLTCPKTCPELDSGCQGRMKIISFIEDEEVTRLPGLFMT